MRVRVEHYHVDKQTNRRKDRQTDKQTERHNGSDTHYSVTITDETRMRDGRELKDRESWCLEVI